MAVQTIIMWVAVVLSIRGRVFQYLYISPSPVSIKEMKDVLGQRKKKYNPLPQQNNVTLNFLTIQAQDSQDIATL